MELSIFIDKQKVYEQVAMTTSYTGAKMTDKDPSAYERIFTSDADQAQLERFWTESRVATCEALKKFIDSERADSTGFTITLRLSSSFDTTLAESIREELKSFFVMNITAKWFVFSNKGEAGEYANSAASYLDGVMRKVCFKKRPKRPQY